MYALITKAGELVLKRQVNPLNLVNATGNGALNHLRDAAIHAVMVVVAPFLGLIAPTKLLLPAMVKINASSRTSSFFLDHVAKTRMISTKQLLLIGAGLVGLATVGYTTGALSALKAVVLPFIPHTTFPLTRQLAAVITGVSMPQGTAVLDALSPEQKRAVLEFLKWGTDAFDELSVPVKWALCASVAIPCLWLVGKVFALCGRSAQPCWRDRDREQERASDALQGFEESQQDREARLKREAGELALFTSYQQGKQDRLEAADVQRQARFEEGRVQLEHRFLEIKAHSDEQEQWFTNANASPEVRSEKRERLAQIEREHDALQEEIYKKREAVFSKVFDAVEEAQRVFYEQTVQIRTASGWAGKSDRSESGR